jgi:NADPH:quinone reductase
VTPANLEWLDKLPGKNGNAKVRGESMKLWRVHRYGPPTEALVLDDRPELEPGPGQIRIAVGAAALNLNDTDMCRGIYPTINPPLPFALGMEVMGRVDRTAPGLEKWLDRRIVAVPLGGHGGYAEQAVATEDMIFDAPGQLDDIGAAAFLIAFQTAHLLLHRRGRLQAGETVLIHSGAGGVGSAAIQLAAAAGARVIATAGGPEKVRLCRELGAAMAIDYRAGNFVEPVLEATGGRGAEVICDLVGGDVALGSFNCIAREGRYLVAGFSGGQVHGEAGLPPRAIAKGNFAVIGGMMGWRDVNDPRARRAGFNPFPKAVGQEIHDDLLNLLQRGKIRPVVGKVVSFTEIPAALEDLEARRTVGKTVARIH